MDLGFQTTYRPSRYEAGWLLSSLYSFYNEGLITDVLALVKGGKEASVYCCQAHPATGLDLLAAKVYRPRMFRNLRNDKMYRQGREILLAGGGPAGRDSGYIERAIRHKTSFWPASGAYVVADVRVHGHGTAVRGRRRGAAARGLQRKRHPDELSRR